MINLKRFCRPDSATTAEPFAPDDGEHTYATNGHVLVRVPRGPDDAHSDHAPNISALDLPWTELEQLQGGILVEMNDIAALGLMLCLFCSPDVPGAQPCEECDSTGGVEFENNYHTYEFGCKSCHGDGIVLHGGLYKTDQCPVCLGTRYDKRYAWRLDKTTCIAVRYLALIIEELGPCEFFPGGSSTEPVAFKAEKGDGFLMPTAAERFDIVNEAR